MYKSHVVTGRVIEIQGDRILTQQGDAICTYHSRYYMLPPIEAEIEVELEVDTSLFTDNDINRSEDPSRRGWIPLRPWFILQKKSANRI
ncbi:hypothetical protein [Paenibacillus wynnii]|uniref:Uncharacterized protein n=1 Tax=Paenibacillus wynnii TaxID=268407 RepID=A0A098MC13_9BACL|nr:hypothetical protein [Paenibacillus wynnii]KGE19566.1 hypothetical protein PWYN_09610 [Paenibacillus wynnii]